MKNKKTEFANDIFWSFTFDGSFQRGNIYSQNEETQNTKGKKTQKENDALKSKFKMTIRDEMESFSKKYLQGEIDDKSHFDNIWQFKNNISEKFESEGLLNDDKFRFGTAQKLFNLYLKILWIFDKIETPPHCPFDRIVAINLLKAEKFNWTAFDGDEKECQTKYQELVDLARKKAKTNGIEIAEWELIEYSNYLKK